MSRRKAFFALAAIFALVAAFLSQNPKPPAPSRYTQLPRGHNNTVLVLSDSHRGLANVLLATSHALLLSHSEIIIHFASFPSLSSEGTFARNIQHYLMPWSGPEYISLYKSLNELIEEVDPAVVVVDSHWGGKYVLLSPNSLQNQFGRMQPRGEVLWKYPIFTHAVIHASAPALTTKRAFLRANGIKNPLSGVSVYEDNDRCLWISQSMKEASYPLKYIPSNVLQVRPIYLSTAPGAEQDAELASWLERGPTLLINIGSIVDCNEEEATKVIKAMRILFDNVEGIQVLWKLKKKIDFGDGFLEAVSAEFIGGRLRLEKWLTIDPGAIMETGNVVCMLHHGGANSFNDAIGAGIPHLVLPMWADTYDHANLVEWLGIGVWASHRVAPEWETDELGSAFFRVCGQGNEAAAMRKKAMELRNIYLRRPGRIAAAEEITKLAAVER
ncbi:glycosyltransferase family 1 protein [Stipitochalara longipes BDJ]|nr:glycosyltransferase family 1 protein [Stipitochalara longipes BDJ]